MRVECHDQDVFLLDGNETVAILSLEEAEEFVKKLQSAIDKQKAIDEEEKS
jgi:hypothetical protein